MEPETVICDDCGAENPRTHLLRQRCERCGASLEEEKARPSEKGVGWAFVMAVSFTLLFFFGPGSLVKFFCFRETPWPLFWLAYTAVFAVGVGLSRLYRPKDNYDLGIPLFGGFIDRPFTLRDDADRAHLAAGFLLLPMNAVRIAWEELFAALKDR